MSAPGLQRTGIRRRLNLARRRLFSAAFLVLMLSLAGPATAAGKPTLEYQVKASYLYNFLQFVEWPPGALAADAILVCVFGQDRFGAALDAIAGENVRGHAIAVRRVHEPEKLNACQVVFLSASEREREALVLQRLAGQPVLTIGETPGFADRGGVINLIQVDDKIRFEINQRAAARDGFRISSQLLQLAVRK